MQINVSKPNFDNDFFNNLVLGGRKGARFEISQKGDTYEASAVAFSRTLGRMIFKKVEDTFELQSSLVIEREFYPREIILNGLVGFLKKRKIKTIIL